MDNAMNEATIHRQLCQYIRIKYPTVIFTSEPSGLRLPIGQAKKLKELRSGTKLPDLWIIEPRGGYFGLFIEIKANFFFKKNGQYKTKHIADQAVMLEKLRNKGYFANFATGFESCRNMIDNYMKLV
jgi:hypothetical protein